MTRRSRLFVDQPLDRSADVALARAQAHYLATVMRLKAGGAFHLFNGRDGEWLARLRTVGKRGAEAICVEKLAEPHLPPDIDYLFAPVKAARLDFIAQKATEMGARRLRPVITARTVVARIKTERLRANAIEAAEQCNLVAIPEVLPEEPLAQVLDRWETARRLVFCDEAGCGTSPLVTLKSLQPGPLAVLVGPEGGFAPEERERLLGLPCVTPVSLGPRILRADTAAVAILALVQAMLGDWR